MSRTCDNVQRVKFLNSPKGSCDSECFVWIKEWHEKQHSLANISRGDSAKSEVEPAAMFFFFSTRREGEGEEEGDEASGRRRCNPEVGRPPTRRSLWSGC